LNMQTKRREAEWIADGQAIIMARPGCGIMMQHADGGVDPLWTSPHGLYDRVFASPDPSVAALSGVQGRVTTTLFRKQHTGEEKEEEWRVEAFLYKKGRKVHAEQVYFDPRGPAGRVVYTAPGRFEETQRITRWDVPNMRHDDLPIFEARVSSEICQELTGCKGEGPMGDSLFAVWSGGSLCAWDTRSPRVAAGLSLYSDGVRAQPQLATLIGQHEIKCAHGGCKVSSWDIRMQAEKMESVLGTSRRPGYVLDVHSNGTELLCTTAPAVEHGHTLSTCRTGPDGDDTISRVAVTPFIPRSARLSPNADAVAVILDEYQLTAHVTNFCHMSQLVTRE
jgi:hypothetical protein